MRSWSEPGLRHLAPVSLLGEPWGRPAQTAACSLHRRSRWVWLGRTGRERTGQGTGQWPCHYGEATPQLWFRVRQEAAEVSAQGGDSARRRGSFPRVSRAGEGTRRTGTGGAVPPTTVATRRRGSVNGDES